jgi:hypothetical protein
MHKRSKALGDSPLALYCVYALVGMGTVPQYVNALV